MSTARLSSPPRRLACALWLPVPRVGERGGAGALVAGIGLLAALAASGAALVHVVEYHLGLAGSGGRWASMRYMLAHCPVRGGLLVVALITLFTLFAVGRELRSLFGEHRRLAVAACSVRAAPPSHAAPVAPRHRVRIIALMLPILAGQITLYALAAHLWPMLSLMRMHGAWMYMAVQGALPLPPLHLVVAMALAALAWRLESRFTALHGAIAALRRILAHVLSILLHRPLPASPAVSWLSSYCAPSVLSRPPPI